MSAVDEQSGSTGTGAVAARPPSSKIPTKTIVNTVVVVVGMLFLFFLLPSLTSNYWLQICTQVVVYSVVALGLALLVGRVGMVSLGQIALLALGGWVALRIGFATGLPFPLLMLAAGIMTGLFGVIIGLPALRLGGLYLALITLMAAAAISIVLQQTNFPNGGGGFLGYSITGSGTAALRRPAHRRADRGLLPLHARRRRAHVPARVAPRPRQAGSRLGGDPPEPAGGAGRRREHHAVQAVGVRARRVHDRRRWAACWRPRVAG